MALRNIVIDGDPILNKKSRAVTRFDDRLAVLIDDMIETMNDADGLGLAAVQVGVLRRIVIVRDGEEILELVNPEITDTSEENQCGPEGCLSFPGESAVVERPMTVTVKAQDRHGETHEYTRSGLTARAFCHEIDHTNGIVFLERALPPEEEEKFWAEHEDDFADYVEYEEAEETSPLLLEIDEDDLEITPE